MFKKLLRSAASSQKESAAAKDSSTVEHEAQDANPDSLADGFALRRIQEDAKAKWTTPELDDKDETPVKATRTRARISDAARGVPKTGSNATKRRLRATVSLDTTNGVDADKQSSARLRACKTVDGGTSGLRSGSSHARKSTANESPEKSRRTRTRKTGIESPENTRTSRSNRTSPRRVDSDNPARSTRNRSSRTPTRRQDSDSHRPKRSSSSTRVERTVRRTRSLERPNPEERSRRAARASAADLADQEDRPMQRSSSAAYLPKTLLARNERDPKDQGEAQVKMASEEMKRLSSSLLSEVAAFRNNRESANQHQEKKKPGSDKDEPEATHLKRPTSVRRIKSGGTHDLGQGKATKKGMRRVKSGSHPRGMEAESRSWDSNHSPPRRKKTSRSSDRSPSRRSKRSSAGKNERETCTRREKTKSASGLRLTCSKSALSSEQNPMITPQAA